MDHANATVTSAGAVIGFEDLWGGGDRDFNDAIITVRQTAPPPAAPAPTAAGPNTNHSGLGDGTNPGQGSGTANSPNTGVFNPHASVTTLGGLIDVRA